MAGNHNPARYRKRSALLLCFCVAAATLAAQEAEENGGLVSGPYTIRQSVEFGGHIADFSGNQGVWETFVNLRSGPRLLEHTLEMRSRPGEGMLFDSFSLRSFGYGGDPNAATRLRMSLGRWYNFNASFRRNLHFWDYNLLANPLNPDTSNPTVPVTSSPHSFHVSRRMSSFELLLLPQSAVRLRLGYGHSSSDGPTLATPRAGTETAAFQPWRNTLHTYRAGVDFRFLERSNVSFDTFFHRYKGDTSVTLQDFPFQLANGAPVDLGIIFNTAANQPCAAPIADGTTSPPTADETCNGFLAYRRSGNVRTSYPTQQLSFQSRYLRRLDLAGRAMYSGADSDVPGSEEFYQGLTTRTRTRESAVTGPAMVRRVSVSADLGATLHVTERLRIVENFRWADYRIPGGFDMQQNTLFGTSMLLAPNTFDPATCPAPFTAATCPQHSTSSPADLISEQFTRFLGQDAKTNTIELEYDFSRRIGARLGHRYRDRSIEIRSLATADLVFFPTLPNRGACAGQPLDANGVCRVTTSDEHAETFDIGEHSLLLGIWTRPTDALRVSFDLEAMSADRAFTRISPRHLQRYSLRASFRPTPWMNLGSTVHIRESRNSETDVNHRHHNRNYSFTAMMAPRESLALDVGYSFHDVFSQALVCFVATPPPPGAIGCGGAFLQDLSIYDADTHFVSAGVMWRPVRRVTATLGYTVNTVSGNTLILNPNAPAGPLESTYHLPAASLQIDITQRWSWKGGWNHYGYNERSDPGLTGPRDFRGNVVTLALRYAF